MNTPTQNYDVIVAGAGMWGCTIARRLAEMGKKVLILEERAQIGGNCACEIDQETGIEVHSYGSHIFHTSEESVWNFVTRFTTFNNYRHKVLANYQGKIYSLPIGLTLINAFFGVNLKEGEMTEFMKDEGHKKAIFDAFIRGYTSKQWGRPPEEVDSSVIARLKVRDNFSVDYFDDKWQGIPEEGYNKLFERMLEHPNITLSLNTTFHLGDFPDKKVYYSGPIDALFSYKHGHLPWRTLRFESEKLNRQDFQGTTVVNYTDFEVPYTRIHEFKHYHPNWKDSDKTIIMREYSYAWRIGDEPYYPIDNEDSRTLLSKYQVEASNYPNLIIGGRLGGYKYFDMDKSILAALSVEL